jgi:hypothetical protein
MAIFKITKGDKQVLPYRIQDLENLTDYSFICTISDTVDGIPFLVKESIIPGEIDVDNIMKNVDINLEIVDFDYNSSVAPGTYHVHLIAIYDDGDTYIPRTIDKSTLEVSDSQLYKNQT